MKAFIAFVLLPLMGWQLGQLVRRRAWKEGAVYIVLMGLALLYSWGYASGWSLPNPYDYLDLIFRPVTLWIESALKSL
ncbi:MAG: hypothetical protein ACUVTU_04995 [Desulfurispora sp.]|uniref:hypothetical protein n=1 Tax=Desulfurispora sp. TaxID=3014275 RepID=UPI00404A8AED